MDSDHWTTAEYLVECALSEDQRITKLVDGEPVDFPGLLGLAPEWESSACDENCQQWVTACLLARTNVTRHVVYLGMRAHHPAIGTSANPSFPHYEASWYGNLFHEDPRLYFCRGEPDGWISAKQQGRTCSTGKSKDCGFTRTGKCQKNRCDFLDDTALDCSADDTSYNTISTFVTPAE